MQLEGTIKSITLKDDPGKERFVIVLPDHFGKAAPALWKNKAKPDDWDRAKAAQTGDHIKLDVFEAKGGFINVNSVLEVTKDAHRDMAEPPDSSTSVATTPSTQSPISYPKVDRVPDLLRQTLIVAQHCETDAIEILKIKIQAGAFPTNGEEVGQQIEDEVSRLTSSLMKGLMAHVKEEMKGE